MTIHLVKLCVGAHSVADLAQWQAGRLAEAKKGGKPGRLFHSTHQTPKKTEELLDGGSLYWVIKGVIQARQRLVGFEDGAKADGRQCCHILLDPELVPVYPVTRRAFQGWRYLTSEEAPADLGGSRGSELAALPAKMRRELAELCLL